MDLLLAALFPLMMSGLGAWGLARLHTKRKRKKQLMHWAHTLLLYNVSKNRWLGVVDEHWVHLAIQAARFELSFRLWPELDLGLVVIDEEVTPPEHVELWREVPGGLRCYGLQPSRLNGLMKSTVRRELAELSALCTALQLTDAQLLLHLPLDTDEEKRTEVLRRAARLLARIDERRAEVEVAPGLEASLERWRPLAATLELQLWTLPLAMTGKRLGHKLIINAVFKNRRKMNLPALDIAVWFNAPLDTPFTLRPQPYHPERFEQAFVLDGDDDDINLVLPKLDEDIRRRMLQLLHDRGALTLNERYLWLRIAKLPIDTDLIAESTDELLHLATDIERSIFGTRQTHNYRRATTA